MCFSFASTSTVQRLSQRHVVLCVVPFVCRAEYYPIGISQHVTICHRSSYSTVSVA